MLLYLSGDPMSCPRPRAIARNGHGAIFMPPAYVEWKKGAALRLAAQWSKAGREFGGKAPIRVSVVAVFARTKSRPDSVTLAQWASGGRVRRWVAPDADNIFKAVADALQDARIIANDSLVEIGFVTRWYGAIGEGAKIEIVLEDI